MTAWIYCDFCMACDQCREHDGDHWVLPDGWIELRLWGPVRLDKHSCSKCLPSSHTPQYREFGGSPNNPRFCSVCDQPEPCCADRRDGAS